MLHILHENAGKGQSSGGFFQSTRNEVTPDEVTPDEVTPDEVTQDEVTRIN